MVRFQSLNSILSFWWFLIIQQFLDKPSNFRVSCPSKSYYGQSPNLGKQNTAVMLWTPRIIFNLLYLHIRNSFHRFEEDRKANHPCDFLSVASRNKQPQACIWTYFSSRASNIDPFFSSLKQWTLSSIKVEWTKESEKLRATWRSRTQPRWGKRNKETMCVCMWVCVLVTLLLICVCLWPDEFFCLTSNLRLDTPPRSNSSDLDTAAIFTPPSHPPPSIFLMLFQLHTFRMGQSSLTSHRVHIHIFLFHLLLLSRQGSAPPKILTNSDFPYWHHGGEM